MDLILKMLDHPKNALELTKLETEAPLLEEVLPELANVFAATNWRKTYRELKELEAQRVKEMFPNLKTHQIK